MKKIITLAYLLLFLKIDMTLRDMSYAYILTNLIGIGLLIYESGKRDYYPLRLTRIFYLFINILLLGLRLLDFEVTSTPLLSFSSYLASFFILIGLIYNIIYPLISFSELLKQDDITFTSSKINNLLINSALFCIPLLIIFFFLFPSLVPIVILIIVIFEYVGLVQIQLHAQSIQT